MQLVSLLQGRGACDLFKEDLFTSICLEVIHLRVVGWLVDGPWCERMGLSVSHGHDKS